MTAVQRGLPHLFQCCMRLEQRFSLGEHEQSLAGNQIVMHLSHQFAKYPLGAISPNRITEPFADHDPDAARHITHLIG